MSSKEKSRSAAIIGDYILNYWNWNVLNWTEKFLIKNHPTFQAQAAIFFSSVISSCVIHNQRDHWWWYPHLLHTEGRHSIRKHRELFWLFWHTWIIHRQMCMYFISNQIRSRKDSILVEETSYIFQPNTWCKSIKHMM